MRKVFIFSLILSFFCGCKKERGGRIDIYLLKSFTTTINQLTNPATIVVSNAVLADVPFVADDNIDFYLKSATTFVLKKDIKSIIENYGPDKAFAVTVDNQPVYYGRFHPGYLSFISFGVATIDPMLYNNNRLQIRFPTINGNEDLQKLDKRNDRQLIDALQATGRLR